MSHFTSHAAGAALALMTFSLPVFPGGLIQVQELDHGIQLSASRAQAGFVTFQVANHASKLKHEMVVVQTTLADDKLPMKGNRVDEAKLKIMGEAADMKPGKSRTLKLNLPAGHYVLICNLPGHYSMGMHAGFTVESGGPAAQMDAPADGSY